MNVSLQTLLVLVLFVLLADVLGGLIVGVGVLIVRKLLSSRRPIVQTLLLVTFPLRLRRPLKD